MPDGSAQPPNGTLSVWIMWSADAREHLSLNPPATAHSPVAYDPGWNVTFGPYTSDGTPTVGVQWKHKGGAGRWERQGAEVQVVHGAESAGRTITCEVARAGRGTSRPASAAQAALGRGARL